MTAIKLYAVTLAPPAMLAVVGLVCEAASAPLSVAVLFWGMVAGGIHCLAVLVYDLIRN